MSDHSIYENTFFFQAIIFIYLNPGYYPIKLGIFSQSSELLVETSSWFDNR